MNETDLLFQEKLSRRGPAQASRSGWRRIRGVTTLEILARVESELRESSGNPKVEELKFVTLVVPV